MSKNVLKVISDGMDAMKLEYDFVRFRKDPIPETYFVGEYTETEPLNEDGMQETTFLLTGFSRAESWLELEDAREQIERYFGKVSGKTVIAEDGSVVAVFYADTQIIPTGDAELKSIQINLHVKEWSVNV